MIASYFTTIESIDAISIECGIGLGVGGALISIALIMLLSSKELISSSILSSPKVKRALDLAIVPLLMVFALDVAYKILM